MSTNCVNITAMNIKELRERAELRTVDVASKIGIAESSVRNWEKGRTIPRLRVDQTAALCRLYKCSIEELEQAVKESISNGGGVASEE